MDRRLLGPLCLALVLLTTGCVLTSGHNHGHRPPPNLPPDRYEHDFRYGRGEGGHGYRPDHKPDHRPDSTTVVVVNPPHRPDNPRPVVKPDHRPGNPKPVVKPDHRPGNPKPIVKPDHRPGNPTHSKPSKPILKPVEKPKLPSKPVVKPVEKPKLPSKPIVKPIKPVEKPSKKPENSSRDVFFRDRR